MGRPLLSTAMRANGCITTSHRQLLLSFSSTPPSWAIPSSSLATTHKKRLYASPSSKRQHPPPSTAAAATNATSTTTLSVPRITSVSKLRVPNSLANPPSTTRPPPLDLPVRPPEATTLSPSHFKHLWATGMAYGRFYKAGLKQIITNTRLLFRPADTNNTNFNDDSAIPRPPRPGSRSHFLLRARWLHDVRRLPLFAVVLIVCGECTPLVVLAFPHAVPLTCRIPKQVDKLLSRAEKRRAEARREAAEGNLYSWSILPRILDLPARFWTPTFLLRRRVEKRLEFLIKDDRLLAEAGGVAGLVGEEVRLACADRGIDVLGRGEEELRHALGRWLRATERAGKEGGVELRREVMMELLVQGEEGWRI
ncbi:hypothetical protein VTJ04DRAFT_7117 [Mycothermus thermophilus]|uniref:uncharacterized protein n=1 Tax=Humicola insolens TaxID=85995 RepID=UPI0037422281